MCEAGVNCEPVSCNALKIEKGNIFPCNRTALLLVGAREARLLKTGFFKAGKGS